MSKKALEDSLALQFDAMKIKYRREVRLFAEFVGIGKGLRERLNNACLKDYRFDFEICELNLLVEVQGGVWLPKGGHNTGTGINRDCEKALMAFKHGYTVLPVTKELIKSGKVVDAIDSVIKFS